MDVFESLDNDEYAYQPTMKVLCDHPDINCIYIVAAGGAGGIRLYPCAFPLVSQCFP